MPGTQESTERGDSRWRSVLRTPTPYVVVLVLALVVPAYVFYLWPDAPPIKGQPIRLILTWVGCLMAIGLWLLCRWQPTREPLLRAFLWAMTGAWVVTMVIGRVHGDSFNYGAWLYVPILLMLLFKTPSPVDAWRGLTVLGWGVAIVLVVTLALEQAGVLEVFRTPDGMNEFEASSYWLPLADLFGLEGRWPGPYRNAVDTAMMGALLVVLAMARWRRSSWVFLSVGVLVLLLTGSRVAFLAVFVAAGLMLLFSRRGRMAGIPTWVRWLVLVAAGGAFGAVLVARGPGLTGRQGIWPEFIALWQTSPIIGAGTSSFADFSNVTAISGHAHNFVLDVLVRYGIVGVIVQFVAIGIGLWILARSAGRGVPGPAALVLFYVVVSMTDVRNDWLHPSLNLMILCLAVVVAARTPLPEREHREPSETESSSL